MNLVGVRNYTVLILVVDKNRSQRGKVRKLVKGDRFAEVLNNKKIRRKWKWKVSEKRGIRSKSLGTTYKMRPDSKTFFSTLRSTVVMSSYQRLKMF